MTLEDVKKHLRITGDEFDDNLRGLLEAATDAAENFTGLFHEGLSRREYQRSILAGLSGGS